jgi:hypothetical protein
VGDADADAEKRMVRIFPRRGVDENGKLKEAPRFRAPLRTYGVLPRLEIRERSRYRCEVSGKLRTHFIRAEKRVA